MVKCAIHQPHFFPWLGYLNKMASVDIFIILNEVQIEKQSSMYRNKLSTWDGVEKYITIPYKKKGCLEKKFSEIEVENTIAWQERQKNFILNNYKKEVYFNEVWKAIEYIFEKKYTTVEEVTLDTILLEKKLFNINTELVLQSDLKYDAILKNNELLICLCKQINADFYLSGNGARKYMDIELFNKNGIKVDYQKYDMIRYPKSHEFIPNLSALDLLFSTGIQSANTIFWENYYGTN